MRHKSNSSASSTYWCVLFVWYEQHVKLMINYKVSNAGQSDGRTLADQISAWFAVCCESINKAVDEPVTTTPACFDTYLTTITNSLINILSSITS
jgi:hypothetical protein